MKIDNGRLLAFCAVLIPMGLILVWFSREARRVIYERFEIMLDPLVFAGLAFVLMTIVGRRILGPPQSKENEES